jgi:hypothetical protein
MTLTKELICSLSIDDHFVKKPIALTKCNHFVCKSCLLNQPVPTVHCKKCDVSSTDIPVIESQFGNQKVEELLDLLIEEAEKRKIDKFQKLTSIYFSQKKHNKVLIQ